jgi:hypothetical protein
LILVKPLIYLSIILQKHTVVMAIQTPEQLGDALAKAIHDPTKSQMAKLTEIVKVVDSDGNETGQEKARFVLKPTAYLGMRIL